MDSPTERCKMYKATLSLMKNKLNVDEKMEKTALDNHFRDLQQDICSENKEVREASLELLQTLIHSDYEYAYPKVFTILHISGLTAQQTILNVLKLDIKRKLGSNRFEQVIKVLEMYKAYKDNQLTNIIKEVCINDVQTERSKIFFLQYVVPCMMALSTDVELRRIIIDVAFDLMEYITRSNLTSDEFACFLNHVTSSYIKNISELRSNGYENWQKLWMFLVRFFGKYLHGSLDLTNRLLRVVEFAFRDSSHQQRLKGYDCWKDLIDNASLDTKHLSSSKQIKLLLTPLKAKFSKQEIVILKRFDIFTHLLEKLQQNSVLVLKEFLEFCFGPLGEDKESVKAGQAKTVSDIWIKSAKVLIEIIGHRHKENEMCLKTDDIIKLRMPVINSNNIRQYYQIVINSVNECSNLLKEVPLDNRKTILKCMWKSLFCIIAFTEKDTKGKCVQLITSIMDRYLGESKEYTDELLTVIFSALLSCEEEIVINSFLRPMLQPLVMIYLTLLNDSSHSEDKTAFEKLLFRKPENGENMLDDVLDIFCKVKANESNAKYIAVSWITLSNNVENEAYEKHVNFLAWPLVHLNNLTDYIDIYEKYKDVLSTYIEKSESLLLKFLKEMEKILTNNPLLCNNIIVTLKLLELSKNTNTDIINTVIRMFTTILIIPSADDDFDHLHSVARIMKKYFSENAQLAKIDNEEIIKNVCACVKHILRDKDFVILNSFNKFLSSISNDIKTKYHKHISLDLLMDLFEQEHDKKIAEEIHEIIENLFMKQNNQTEKKKDSPQFTGRSAKIASLVQNNPRVYQRHNKTHNLTSLSFFSNNDKSKPQTPVKIRGSLLSNLETSSPLKKPKKTLGSPLVSNKNPSPPPIDDESSSQFVKIDTEVKLQPDKLTEKQKEILKKRREDIPALYQDLSQSNSQDLFSEKSSSLDTVFKVPVGTKDEKTAKKDVPEERSFKKSDKSSSKPENEDIFSKETVETIKSQDVLEERSSKVISSKKNLENEPIKDLESPKVVIANIDGQNCTAKQDSKELHSKTGESKDLTPKESDISSNLDNKAKNLDPDETLLDEKQSKEDSSSEKMANFSENLLEQPESLVTDLMDNKKMEESLKKDTQDVEEDNKREETEKERKRRLKIEAELKKLSMDIVGADQFVSNDRRKRDKRKTVGGDEKEELTTPKSKRKSLGSLKRDKKDSSPSQESKNSDTDSSFIFAKIDEKKKINTSPQCPKTSDADLNDIVLKSETKRRVRPKEINKNESEIEQNKHNESQTETPKKPRKKGKAKTTGYKQDEEQLNKLISVLMYHNEMFPKGNEPEKKLEKPESDDFKTGKKRKRSSIDDDSEDIIESSQEVDTSGPIAITNKKNKHGNDASVNSQETLQDKNETTQNFHKSARKSINKYEKSAPGRKRILEQPSRKNIKVTKVKIIKNTPNKNKNLNDSQKLEDSQSQHSTPIKEKDSNKKPIGIEKLLDNMLKPSRSSPKKQNVTPVKDEICQQKDVSGNLKINITQMKPVKIKVNTFKSSKSDANKTTENTEDIVIAETEVIHSTQSQETETQTDKHQLSPDEVEIQLDLPQKPILTESEKEICEADTLTQNSRDLTLTNNSGSDVVTTINEKYGKLLKEFENLSPVRVSQVKIKSASNTPTSSPSKPVIIRRITPKKTSINSITPQKELAKETSETPSTRIISNKIELTDNVLGGLIIDPQTLQKDQNKTKIIISKTKLADIPLKAVEPETSASCETHNIAPNETEATKTVVEVTVGLETQTEPLEVPLTLESPSGSTVLCETPKKVRNITSQVRETSLQYLDSETPLRGFSETSLTESSVPGCCETPNKSKKIITEVVKTPENSMECEDSCETPGKRSSLPGSPVTCETPNRTNELLNDTVDISPISSKSSSEEEVSEKNVDEISSFKEDVDEITLLKEYVLKTTPVKTRTSPRKLDKSPETLQKIVPLALSPPKATEGCSRSLESSPEKAKTCEEVIDKYTDTPVLKTPQNIAERSSRFFEMAKSGPSVTQQRFFLKRKSGVIMSPSTLRIKKLMSNFRSKNVEEPSADVKEEDILTFSREVPSPLAVPPRGGILKRKMADAGMDEGLSPCAKRKRVNFSDPCTTSKKVFIKDQNEASCFIEPIAPPPQYLADLFDLPPEDSEKLTETENVDTEESLQVFNPLILRKDRPIYPKLTDCTDDVVLVLKKVTSPMFITTLMNKLKVKNIKTVGDLAKQSEADVSKLPFKVPVVANVHKALESYYNKHYKNRINNEGEVDVQGDGENGGLKSESVGESTGVVGVSKLRKLLMTDEAASGDKVMKTEDIKKMHPEDKLVPTSSLIEAKPTGLPVVFVNKDTTAFSSSIAETAVTPKVKITVNKVKVHPLPLVDELRNVLERAKLEESQKPKLTSIITQYYNITDLITPHDYKPIVKHVVDHAGLPKIFEILTETIESPNDESIYFDCMLKHCIDNKPLSTLIEKREPRELSVALSECLERGAIEKKDLIEKCFVPLIKSPKELDGYFKSLTVVEVGDLVIGRLGNEDFEAFFGRIVENFDGGENVAVSQGAKKTSVAESTSRSSEKIIHMMRTFIGVQSQQEQTRILVELAKSLPMATLISVQMEFLQSVLSKIGDTNVSSSGS